MLIRTAAGWLSPAGARARLTILIFHRVLPAPDELSPWEPDARRFDQILTWISDWFVVLPLGQAVEAMNRGDLPSRALSITFDDGYADNHDIALPLLQRHAMSAAFFVATGFLDGGRMWNDSVIESVRRSKQPVLDLRGLGLEGIDRLPLHDVPQRRVAIDRLLRSAKYLETERRLQVVDQIAARAECELPGNLMMTTRQLETLHAAGMDIGAHTAHHPILAQLDRNEARREIELGRAQLERATGRRISLFAYPNGKPGQDYSPASVRLVRELGFDAAVTTAPGVMGADTDRWQIPRFTPWDRSRTRFGARLLSNLARPANGAQT